MKTSILNFFLLVAVLGGFSPLSVFAQQVDSVVANPSTQNPIVMLGGKKNGESITVNELRAVKKVECVMVSSGKSFPVVSFSLVLKISGQEITEPANNGQLTEKQIQLLSKVKSGSKITLIKVVVQKPGGAVVEIGGAYILKVI